MILVCVGTQFPFDRLVRAVDVWARGAGRSDVVAQTGPSNYVPDTLKVFEFLGPDAFRKLVNDAEIIIAHAGIGSILSALECGKPIIIMPRDHRKQEHRNAHQLGTADRFRGMPGVYVVDDELELRGFLDRLPELVAANGTSKASSELVARLRDFIDENEDEADTPSVRRVFRGLGAMGGRILNPTMFRLMIRGRAMRKT